MPYCEEILTSALHSNNVVTSQGLFHADLLYCNIYITEMQYCDERLFTLCYPNIAEIL